MVRLKALIAYDGTEFYGWQMQRHYPTIQSTIETALQKVCRKPVKVTGAGRTDSGVHAYEQVAHFDWEHHLPPEKLLLAVNTLLPYSIRVFFLQPVDSQFHARFDARSKIYLYRIDPSRVCSPFSYRFALHYPRPLDLERMQECGRMMEGEHDFAAFQATGTEIVSTQRTVFRVEMGEKDALVFVRIHATGFLRKMVRFIVGTILEVGSGKKPMEDLRRALDQQDKNSVGVPVPARGLFLEKVFYDSL